MNKKKLAMIILAIFIIGMCIGAADAAHTVKKGKYKAKLSKKEYKKLTKKVTKSKNVRNSWTEKVQVGSEEIPVYKSEIIDQDSKYYSDKYLNKTQYKEHDVSPKDKPTDSSKDTYTVIKKYNETGSWTWSNYHLYQIERGTYNHTWIDYYDYKPIYKMQTYYDDETVYYKVRAKTKVQKTVGYKKVKLDRVVGHKYKTVYKYKTVKLKQAVYNAKADTYTSYRGTHHKYLYKDWKLVKTITKYKSDGSYIVYDIIKSKKKLAVKERYPIIKSVKTKKRILMNIRTTDFAGRLLKGKKVYVEIYCNGELLREGTAKIK